MGVRAELKAKLEEKINPSYPGIQVYGQPEDVTQLPAVVLVPGDPWCQPETFGGNRAGAVRWSFEIALCASRADVESAIEMMESLRLLCEDAVGELGGIWGALGRPDTIPLADIPALMAEMSIELVTTQTS